ncbi:hypothetical protein ACVBEF_18930, partial [Glaciimonas sp. GG7]
QSVIASLSARFIEHESIDKGLKLSIEVSEERKKCHGVGKKRSSTNSNEQSSQQYNQSRRDR